MKTGTCMVCKKDNLELVKMGTFQDGEGEGEGDAKACMDCTTNILKMFKNAIFDNNGATKEGIKKVAEKIINNVEGSLNDEKDSE